MKKTLLLLSLLFYCLSVFGQTRIVTGTVTDQSSGETLPGVNVVLVGTVTGSVTDINGNFQIRVPVGRAFLQFSFIGFETQEVEVTDLNTVMVQLQTSALALEEMVVVGYGTMRRSDITGSVASVRMTNEDEKAYSNFQQILSGRVAGVVVSETSGQPGSGLNIEIRGASSLNFSTQPLYVIDGVPFDVPDMASGTAHVPGVSTSPLAIINPNDILSIEVLKDASATAIYGSRGANGVILITTRSGVDGAPSISVNFTQSFLTPTSYYDMLDGPTYAQFVNEAHRNRDGSEASIPFTTAELQNLNDFDHQRAITQTGQLRDLNLNVSGGSRISQYFISAQYYNQDGIILNTSLDRYNLRINLDSELSTRLSLRTSATVIRTFQQGRSVSDFAGNFLRSAVMWAPTSPLRNPDGTYNIIDNFRFGDTYMLDPNVGPVYYKDRFESNIFNLLGSDRFENPLAFLEAYTNDNTRTQMLGHSTLTYALSDHLKLNAKVAVTLASGKVENYRPTFIPIQNYKGMAYISHIESSKLLYESTLQYNRRIRRHSINGVLGATAETFQSKSFTAQTREFTQDVTGVNLIEAGSVIGTPTSAFSGYQLLSFLGRVNYNYRFKYYATFSARYDGSSKFAPENRFGFFPSGAVSWRINNEDFMKNLDFISDMRLRFSYGITGNQAVGPYNTLALLGSGDAVAANKYNNTFGGVVNIGYAPEGIPNTALQWEQTEQTNLGLDIGLFNNRIEFNAELYNRYTSRLLYNVEIPWSSGYRNLMSNIGEISNKGLELTLNTVNIATRNFQWQTYFNVGWNQNMVEKLTGVEGYYVPVGGGAPMNLAPYSTLLEAGQSLGQIYGYETLPVWTPVTLADKPLTFQAGVGEGDRRYKDQNDDGLLNEEDRVVLGNALPTFTGGFGTMFQYKSFDLSASFSFSYGNMVVNAFNINISKMGNIENVLRSYYENRYVFITDDMDQDDKNRFAEHNAQTHYQAAGGRVDEREIFDLRVEDGSFIRCRDISIGYTLPTTIAQRIRLSSLRVFANVLNPFIITNYTGTNPEAVSRGLESGIDRGAYPLSRTFNFGLSLNY